MILDLVTDRDVREAQALIERNGLVFEGSVDGLVGYYDNGALAGTGARRRNVLKMLAVEPAHRGGAALGELVAALVSQGMKAGFDSLFVFTKPRHAPSFESLNFQLLARQEQAVMMEFGRGLSHWLDAHRAALRAGENGAVVAHCAPFSAAHRRLVERAARQVEHLYLFVVRESGTALPFDARLRMAREGTEDLGNVLVLDTGPYRVDAANFPCYFLQPDDPVVRIRMELDAALFAGKIAPFFGIGRRFASTGPGHEAVRARNQALRRILPQFGIALTEIEPLPCRCAALG